MSSMNSMRLRELIRSVRQCKTASDERALINRECAEIRQGFKENTPYLRTRNMLKLLYIHMLGYPTEFGQLEVVNLISQADFSGKRIGYLALQLLLSENDEVLTLSENRMKTDMSSGNPLVQAVALHAAANVASEDMARDVFDEIIKLVKSNNSYIRKKASLAALRIVKKVPEYAEYFLECFTDLFTESHSSTMMCSVTLINACLETQARDEFIARYRKLATPAVRILKALVLSSRATDSDVGNITDPFLQVKVLQFMRLIGTDSPVTSEALNDVLAQVITNTDATRNVGCAVHYECVRTIDSVESDEGLRALAVNTIGRFLASSRDNNLRFVALQTLLDYAKRDVETVQQHQDVILECLKDSDISIRRRALELTVALITEGNVRLLVPDLLTYLSLCAEEMRGDVTHHVCHIIEEKSPGDEWRVELSLKLLKLASHHAPVDFATRLIAIISCQPDDIKQRAVAVLWEEASFPFDAIHQARRAFLVVSLWCIGEYPHLLLRAETKATPSEVAGCVSEITANTRYSLVKQYGLTALMKLATKYPEAQETALSMFSGLLSSLDCELQQRAREYTMMLKNFPEVAAYSFSAMPNISPQTEVAEVRPVPVVPQEMLQQQAASALDDLFDGAANTTDNRGSAPPPHANTTASPPSTAIDDLFGGSAGGPQVAQAASSSAPAAAAAAGPVPINVPDPFSSLFGGGDAGGAQWNAAATTEAKASKVAAEEEVFSNGEVTVSLVGTQYSPSTIHTEVVFRSTSSVVLDDVACLLATLKNCTLTASPLSSRSIAPLGHATIRVSIDVNGEAKLQNQLMMRVILSYVVAGVKREHQINVTTHAKQ